MSREKNQVHILNTQTESGGERVIKHLQFSVKFSSRTRIQAASNYLVPYQTMIDWYSTPLSPY